MEQTIQGAVIPLNRAALCLNDDTLFDLSHRTCPTCASRAWMLLSAWLTEKVH